MAACPLVLCFFLEKCERFFAGYSHENQTPADDFLSMVVDGVPVVVGVAAVLPQMRFVTRSFRVTTIHRVRDDIEWQTVELNMPDMLDGGPTRRVLVETARDAESVLVKSVENLQKRDFEELFGFGVGQFVAGRVIALDASAIRR